MKVVRLSALCAINFTPREYSLYSFLLEADLTQDYGVAQRIILNSSDTIENQTHDLPACNALPQPNCTTVPPIQYVLSVFNFTGYMNFHFLNFILILMVPLGM